MDGIEENIELMKAKLQQYKQQDIWIADETGLLFCMPPDRTNSSQPMPGRKKVKKNDIACLHECRWVP